MATIDVVGFDVALRPFKRANVGRNCKWSADVWVDEELELGASRYRNQMACSKEVLGGMAKNPAKTEEYAENGMPQF